MRSGSIALRAAGAALVFVLAPSAGGAHAHDGVGVTVTPSAASPGDDLDVRVLGCAGATGVATSPAFAAAAELAGRDGGHSPLYGDTGVKAGLESGTYPVDVVCDGHRHRDAGVVRIGSREPARVAPVRAGGGAAVFAAPAAPGVAQAAGENGLGTPYTVIGLGLAAVAAVAVAFRSSRRRDDGPGTGTAD
ncbi:hypothetical protein [Streptomyces sp. NPDC001744]|uniref:hypothetical protein n=1 Tax=Streptomyces sp. NPDC001744 TaxID=3364606 RepID=UPI0036C0BD83